MNIMTLPEQPASGGFRVDVLRGQHVGRVSSEWFARPDDERYPIPSELYDAERAQARMVESRAIRVEANRENAERLALTIPGLDAPVVPLRM